MNNYDSRPETTKHIRQVQKFMTKAIDDLERRAEAHDQSKLIEPELSAFNKATSKLKHLTYGSPEYDEARKELGEALNHHYANNSHHPEHFENGIKGMSLLSLTEMMCDWAAAVKRHSDGDLRQSIEINQERFGYSDELKAILFNTAEELNLFD